jgi:ATP-dependent DNA ligase
MFTTTGQPVRDFSAWSWEVNWDGWRALVYIDGDLRVQTRTGRQVRDSLPELIGLEYSGFFTRCGVEVF